MFEKKAVKTHFLSYPFDSTIGALLVITVTVLVYFQNGKWKKFQNNIYRHVLMFKQCKAVQLNSTNSVNSGGSNVNNLNSVNRVNSVNSLNSVKSGNSVNSLYKQCIAWCYVQLWWYFQGRTKIFSSKSITLYRTKGRNSEACARSETW